MKLQKITMVLSLLVLVSTVKFMDTTNTMTLDYNVKTIPTKVVNTNHLDIDPIIKILVQPVKLTVEV